MNFSVFFVSSVFVISLLLVQKLLEGRKCAFLLSFNPLYQRRLDFPGGLDGKASAYSAGELGSIPGPRRSPGEGNGNRLLYSCLGNPMDQGDWRVIVHGVPRD